MNQPESKTTKGLILWLVVFTLALTTIDVFMKMWRIARSNTNYNLPQGIAINSLLDLLVFSFLSLIVYFVYKLFAKKK